MSTTDDLERKIRETITELQKSYIREHGKAPKTLRITEEFEDDLRAAQLPAGDMIMGMDVERDADKVEVV